MTAQTWAARRTPGLADRTADVGGANPGNREQATGTKASGDRLRAGRLRA